MYLRDLLIVERSQGVNLARQPAVPLYSSYLPISMFEPCTQGFPAKSTGPTQHELENLALVSKQDLPNPVPRKESLANQPGFVVLGASQRKWELPRGHFGRESLRVTICRRFLICR